MSRNAFIYDYRIQDYFCILLVNFVFTFHSTAHQIFPEYLDLLQNLPQYLHLLSELPKLYPVIFPHQFNDQSNCWIHFPSH